MHNDAIESKSVAATDAPAAAIPLVPMLACLAAGLALSFTPVVVWRMTTGKWVCLQQPETLYYLQIAAQSYYNHLRYISDPVIREGAIFYPWLQFVPPVMLVRLFGLSIFSVALIWSFCAGVGIGASLYLLFWRFLRRPWMPAGLTIFCLSDLEFCGHLPVVLQLRRLISALVIHRSGNLTQTPLFFFQWRAPEPALALPFLFLQILAVSNAREHPRRVNLWVSGMAFGLLFYVFFYLWTMVAAGLFVAMLIDRAARRVYLWTFLIGVSVGLPQLALNLRSRAMASAEGAARLGVFVRNPDLSEIRFPFLSLAIVVFVVLWIRKNGRFELLYLVSLVIAGILLGYSGRITGLFYHEYHFQWLWWPIRLVLVLIVIATIAQPRIARWPRARLVFPVFAIIYLISGMYLLAIDITRTRFGVHQREDFVRYSAQRMAPGVAPLIPRSVVAGSESFAQIAAVAENQRMLSGWTIAASPALDNSGWESRVALNAVLMGDQRADFEQVITEVVYEFWFLEPIQPQLQAGFMRHFDEIAQDPADAIRALEVRYIALPAGQPPTAYVASRFHLIQPGPYWQIWQTNEF
jgi:hypothetical protein